jgi:hypothetical protein
MLTIYLQIKIAGVYRCVCHESSQTLEFRSHHSATYWYKGKIYYKKKCREKSELRVSGSDGGVRSSANVIKRAIWIYGFPILVNNAH